MDTQNLAVQIVRFVDESFPGWVECHFADAAGRVHVLVDKYPSFSALILDAASGYPRPGQVQCEILGRSQNARGATVVHVRIPDIESSEGLSEFTVLPTQLSTIRLQG